MTFRRRHPGAPLSAASLALAAGVILGSWLGHPVFASLPTLAAFLAVVAGLSGCLPTGGSRARRHLFSGLMLVACCLAGLARGGSEARLLDDQSRLAATACAPAWVSGHLIREGGRVLLVADSVRAVQGGAVRPVPGGFRLLLPPRAEIGPGATGVGRPRVAGFGSMEPTGGSRRPGGWNEKAWAATWGAAATMRPWGPLRAESRSGCGEDASAGASWRGGRDVCAEIAAQVRTRGTRSLRRAFPGQAGDFLARFLLGRHAPVNDRSLEAGFRAGGLGHILAVSGFHVGCVAASLALLARVLSRGRWVRCTLLLLGILAYGTLVGGGNAVTRAVGVASAWLILRGLGRSPGPTGLLYLVLAGALWVNPHAWQQAGFQLTYLVTWALLRGARRQSRTGRSRTSVGRQLRRLGRAAIAAQAAAWPLTLAHWGGASPLFLISNLAFAPLAAGMVPLAGLGILLDALPGFPADLGCGAARALIELVLRGVDLQAGLCQRTSLPGGLPVAVGIGLSLAVGTLAGMRGWRGGIRPWAALLPALVAVVVVTRPASGPSFVMLDTGQGEAWVVLWAEETWVIDTGPPPGEAGRARDLLIPTLRWYGRRRIDRLILTHDDLDHTGGLQEVARGRLPVGEVDRPARWSSSQRTEEYLRLLRTSGASVCSLAAGDTLRTRDGFAAVLHPPAQGGATFEEDRNAGSLVLLLECRGGRLLIWGDLPAENQLDVAARLEKHPDLIMTAAHHGSGGSTPAVLLSGRDNGLLLISAGRENRHGHPSARILADAARAGWGVLRTDRDGSIVLSRPSGAWRVRTTRSGGDWRLVSASS